MTYLMWLTGMPTYGKVAEYKLLAKTTETGMKITNSVVISLLMCKHESILVIHCAFIGLQRRVQVRRGLLLGSREKFCVYSYGISVR